MSVLKCYFNRSMKYSSPTVGDFVRVSNYDSDGRIVVTRCKFDYPKYQKSLGNIVDWSLNSLMKAGINPDFPIHTGLNTRLEGLGVIENASAVAEEIINESNVKSE